MPIRCWKTDCLHPGEKLPAGVHWPLSLHSATLDAINDVMMGDRAVLSNVQVIAVKGNIANSSDPKIRLRKDKRGQDITG